MKITLHYLMGGRIYDVKNWCGWSNVDGRQILLVRRVFDVLHHIFDVIRQYLTFEISFKYNHNFTIKNVHFDSQRQYLMSRVKTIWRPPSNIKPWRQIFDCKKFDRWHQIERQSSKKSILHKMSKIDARCQDLTTRMRHINAMD